MIVSSTKTASYHSRPPHAQSTKTASYHSRPPHVVQKKRIFKKSPPFASRLVPYHLRKGCIIGANINILYAKNQTKTRAKTYDFGPTTKSFEEVCNDVSIEEEFHKIIRRREKQHPRDIYLSTDEYEEVEKDPIQDVVYETYMTEIQLRRIVDRNAQEGSEQQSNGAERMVKDGDNISRKFSKEAMTLGDDVYAYEGNAPANFQKVYDLYDHYVGEERVFPIKNGAPRIMTKYKDVPYSYELQPEYAAGNKKFPCVKAMDWTGKTASAQVIRGFVRSTSVVEGCALPLCISRW